MLKESVEWEEGENLPLHYNASDLIVKGRCKSVHLPRELTGDLAEEVGIHISDGYMKRVAVVYCGHEEDDEDYLRYRVSPLLKRIWGLKKVGWRMQPDSKCLKLKVYSRRIVLFKEKVLGLPCGAKEGIQIPERLLMRRSLVRRLLSGLFDGDGSISFKSKAGLGHTYPVINYGSKSLPLLRQVQELLRKLEFTVPNKLSDKKDGIYILCINGDKNYERWMNLIGFSNPKHLTKVVLYETFGLVPPGTGLRERLNLIRREVKLSEVYPINELRTNKDRVIEKEVLQQLLQEERYISELGKVLGVYKQRVINALRRLSKRGLVAGIESSNAGKKYYRVTRWGVNKLNRVETIVKRLREEFQLAI